MVRYECWNDLSGAELSANGRKVLTIKWPLHRELTKANTGIGHRKKGVRNRNRPKNHGMVRVKSVTGSKRVGSDKFYRQ